MIEEVNMNAGDLVIATDVSFEGDKALSVGTPGLVKQWSTATPSSPTGFGILDALWLSDLGAPRRH